MIAVCHFESEDYDRLWGLCDESEDRDESQESEEVFAMDLPEHREGTAVSGALGTPL